MTKAFLFKFGILIFISFSACISGCDEKGVSLLFPPSNYTINNVAFNGQGTVNKTNPSIEVPCNNNNTIHVYFSRDLFDSVRKKINLSNPYGSQDVKVVSNGRAGNLKWNECYIEVNTSATDTWLSTGTDNKTVSFHTHVGFAGSSNDIIWYYEFTDVALQHWTSVPLNDFGKVTGTLITPDFY